MHAINREERTFSVLMNLKFLAYMNFLIYEYKVNTMSSVVKSTLTASSLSAELLQFSNPFNMSVSLFSMYNIHTHNKFNQNEANIDDRDWVIVHCGVSSMVTPLVLMMSISDDDYLP